MGEHLFNCPHCNNATSDYRGGQCGNCYEMYCWDCTCNFGEEYGDYVEEDPDRCSPKACIKCIRFKKTI